MRSGLALSCPTQATCIQAPSLAPFGNCVSGAPPAGFGPGFVEEMALAELGAGAKTGPVSSPKYAWRASVLPPRP
jgi:hypothetical protein